MHESHRRIFLAIMLTPHWQKKISNLHPSLNALNLSTMRVIPPEKLHITLHFWANANLEQIRTLLNCTKQFCQYFPAFSVALGDIELFPSETRPYVLAIKIKQANVLRAFRENLSQQFFEYGIPVERRTYKPHISIARIAQKIAAHNSLILQPLDQEPMYVASISLLESTFNAHENIYTPLAKFELQ